MRTLDDLLDEFEWAPELEDECDWEAETIFNFSKEVPASIRGLLPSSVT